MIPVYFRCNKCKKYEPSGSDVAVQIRTVNTKGQMEYKTLPNAWHTVTSQAGGSQKDVVFCGDCLPSVLREVFE